MKQEYTDDINPISRLIQIQQAKKEREPEYSLVEERGVPRRREFVMEVLTSFTSCTLIICCMYCSGYLISLNEFEITSVEKRQLVVFVYFKFHLYFATVLVCDIKIFFLIL